MTTRVGAAWTLATLFLALTRGAEMWLNASAVGGATELDSAGAIAGLVAAAAIHAMVIVWLAARSRLPDPARKLAIVGVGLGFVVVNNLEAMLFGIAPFAPLLGLAVAGAVVHGLAVLWITSVIPPPASVATHSQSPFAGFIARGIVVRTALLGLIYAVIYFAAGATIYPFVQEFYANKPLPATGPLFVLQAVVRGPIFVGVGALVVALLRSTRGVHAAAVALTLAGLGGVTALLVPNPLFPDHIRLVHLAEVGVSNLVFGALVGWALTSARPARRPVASPVAPSSS